MALNSQDRERAWIYFNELFGGNARCVFCLSDGKEHGNGLTLDHIIPQEIGGGDEIWNLQPLCSQCHRMKNLLIDVRGSAGQAALKNYGLVPDKEVWSKTKLALQGAK